MLFCLSPFRCVSIIVIFVLSSSVALAEAPPAPRKVQNEMGKVYDGFLRLYRYLADEEQFSRPENEKAILEAVRTLRQSFHSSTLSETNLRKEPGFESTLHAMRGMLEDAEKRVVEGKKPYALWRLRTTTEYCISCHTRHDVQFDFDGKLDALKFSNDFEKAELFLATRQFEKASDMFLSIVHAKTDNYHRMDALRRWLVIAVRVKPNPKASIRALEAIEKEARFDLTEKEEIAEWLASFHRWAKEAHTTLPAFEQAKNLIQTALSQEAPFYAQHGTVELLRATALLHAELERVSLTDVHREGNDQQQAEVLYLLGLSYSELPLFFLDDLGQTFLESCIREYPNSEVAQKSYRLYKKLTLWSFTGSGGSRVPQDVHRHLEELKELAY
jgi:hypothetical protein